MKYKIIVLGILICASIVFISMRFYSVGETIVTKDQLPEKASAFIQRHYAHHNLNYIIREQKFFSKKYEVKFTNGMEINFDSQGNWTEIDAKYATIDYSVFSQKIGFYLASHFPGTQILKAERKNFGRQEIKISNGLELLFSSQGEFKSLED
ncbi:PepSY-like domain-containing protein [Apibacter sp. HY039]|uniref:PepSY-like domain-containing protein n=1 Tax=Apibacter sp. HY039 TaxID=2501476 RepID=UPI000FEB839A|nr:PepSY-like domain-containing protein [Apibacter sp. HY039]